MPDPAYIQFLNGPRSNEKLQLEQYPMTFGRTSDSDIEINWDALVSSRHFEIYLDEDAIFLRDSGSRNGTKINGSVVLRQRLYNGDIIEVGNTQLQVAIEPKPTLDKTPLTSSEDPVLQQVESSERHPSGSKRINPFESGFSDEAIDAPQSDTAATTQVIQQVRLRISEQSASGLGTQPIHKLFWLSPGQTMVFGRSPRCDCSIETDSFMSSTHFKVTCELQHCLIEDLGSKSGTLLNDVSVTQAKLYHGDRILAGRTEFRIEVDGSQSPILRTEKIGASQASLAPVELPVPLQEPLTLTCEKCPSGVYVLKGILQAQLPLPVLVSWIRSVGRVYFLMDTSRGSLPLPGDYDPVSGQLFYWLPPDFAGSSPQLVSSDELSEWQSHLNDLLGNDGLVVLQSEAAKPALLATLKTCLTGTPDSKKPFQGIVGICWPSVMSAAIQSQAGDFATRLLKDVSLVITEGDGGKAYLIFASQSQKIDAVLGMLDRRQIKYSIQRNEENP